MSYESAVVLFIIFLIPAGIYLVTSIMHLRQYENEKQTDLDVIFSTHMKNSVKYHQ